MFRSLIRVYSKTTVKKRCVVSRLWTVAFFSYFDVNQQINKAISDMHKDGKPSDELIMDFYYSLTPDFDVPDGVEIMNPFENHSTAEAANRFYQRFYHDRRPRIFLFGINPGRFGAGVTGVPFTDPIRLQEVCGIENVFDIMMIKN
jgi:hypothetical protein